MGIGVALGIAQVGLSIFGGLQKGNAEADAARDANKAAIKQAKEQHELDMKLWEISVLQGKSTYAAKVAETSALRYQNLVKKTDYEDQQGRVIEAALQNLRLNAEGLNQTYVLEEAYRARQESQALVNDLGNQSITAQENIDSLIIQSAEARRKSIAGNIQTLQATAQYLDSIQTKGLQADKILAAKETQGQEIQEMIILSESMDTIKRDAAYLAAIAEDAGLSAKASARQGGSNSAKRQGLQAMQALGRTYGEMMLAQKDKRRNLSKYNSQLVGETANDLAILASQMGAEADKIKYTSSNNAIAQKGYELMQLGFGNQMQASQSKFQLGTRNSLKKFTELTIPSFALAKATGDRQAETLIRNTMSRLDAAGTPFREDIIFDPLEPIAGLKPEYSKPTERAVPGQGTIWSEALMGGAKTAIGLTSTDNSGNLKFGY